MHKYIAITVDYETWHPMNNGWEEDWKRNGFKIDFENDIINAASIMMSKADEVGVKLTFMVEMCEYFWLKQNIPVIANKMEEQWKEIIWGGA